MRLIWTPPSGEPREWIFRTEELLPHEYEPIEECGGGAWDNLEDFDLAMRRSMRKAWRVALWICLRRDRPDLRLAEVVIRADELAMRYEPFEELAIAELALADPDLSEEARDFWARELPTLQAAAGKAPVPSGGADEQPAGT